MEEDFKSLQINSFRNKDVALTNGSSSKNSKKKRRHNRKHNTPDTPQAKTSDECKLVQDDNFSTEYEFALSSTTCTSLISQKLYLEPQGLVNVKNSCFLNASLQLLLHVPPLCALFKYLQTQLNKHTVSIKSQLSKQCGDQSSLLIPLLSVYSQFDCRMEGSNSTVVFERPNQFGISTLSASSNPPIKISSEIKKSLQLDAGIQEDVAECLTRILSQLHEELGSLLSHSSNNGSKPTCTAGENDDDSDWIVTDRAGKRHPVARTTELDGGQSPIGTLFSGTLMTRSSVQAIGKNVAFDQHMRQNDSFATKEPFFILPLEIHHSKISSIESALRHLSEPEQVTDYRNTSEINTSMRRRTVLDRLPPYLLLQLKRFTYVSTYSTNDGSAQGQPLSWNTQKCLKLISVDQEIIIPKALLSQEKYFTVSDRRYRLLGVIFHLGDSAVSGHYAAAIRKNDGHTDASGGMQESAQFIYIDDTRLCLVGNSKSVESLLCTHQPLDPDSGNFYPLQKRPLHPTNILYQARTPYILLYESYTRYLN